MKHIGIIFTMFLLAGFTSSKAQQDATIDSSYANGYYLDRVKYFSELKVRRNPVVFIGNSITEVGEWSEIFCGRNVINRGISGDNSFGVLARIDSVLKLKPRKIFLMIGVNDIKRGTPPELILVNHVRIISRIRSASPKTKIFIQSVLPVNESMLASIYSRIKNEKINALNDSLKIIAREHRCEFIDLNNEVFRGGDGQLKKELSTDGLHLKHTAYFLWADHLISNKYID